MLLLQLLRERVQQCYRVEGVNHYQNCREVRPPLLSVCLVRRAALWATQSRTRFEGSL